MFVYHRGRTQEDWIFNVDRRRNIGRGRLSTACIIRYVGFVFKGVI
jgi:hypothetical protein